MTEPTPAPSVPERFRILFVCTGNTCRSPMAEAIARSELERRGWTQVEVASAGSSAVAGAPASGGAVRASHTHGLDLSEHRSRPLTSDLVAWADLILTMSWHHAEAALALGGVDRTTLLTAFAAGADGADASGVPDPFGGSDAKYEATFQAIRSLVAGSLERLEPILAP